MSDGKKKFKFFSRRFLVFALLVSGAAFGLGTVLAQTLPKVKSWLLVSVDNFSRDNLPVRILPGSVDFRIFPIGVTLNDVRILPSGEFDKILSPLTIQELSIDFSFFQIIRGEVSVEELAIRGTSARLTIPKPKTTGGKPLEGLFKELDRIPVSTIILSEISAEVSVPHLGLEFDVEQLGLNVDRSRAKLSANLIAESILIKDLKGQRALRIAPEIALIMTPTNIEILNLEVRRGTSVVSVTGRLDGDTEGLEFSSLNLKSNLSLDVKSTRDWIQKSFEEAEPTPPMSGTLVSDIEIQKTAKSAPVTAKFDLATVDYRVQGIHLDKVKGRGAWDGKYLSISELASVSRSGTVTATDLRIGEGVEKTPEGRTPWLLRIGKLKGAIEVHEFLADMGIGPIPVWLSAQGEFPCESQLVPKFILRCGGVFSGQNLVVQGDLQRGRVPKDSIVAIPSFTSKGDFSFDLQKFSYQTEIEMPNSKGRSSGEVRYKTGFDIQYEADTLALKDLASLGDLNILGSLKLKGSTIGNSSQASLRMEAEGQDLWLENFWLGQPKGIVTYKTGKLGFNSLQGFYTTSRYSGDVTIDLQRSVIDTNLKVPFFDARDLLKVFSKKFTLPIAVTGTGQASIKASGPLDISRMTYDLKSSLFKGTVAGENFDQAHFDVKSKAGDVRSERVSIQRGESVIQLTGRGSPDGTIETELRGRGLKLEETNFISESGFALTGVVGFDMTMKGPVLAPDTAMKGTLSRTTIAESNVPDSEFQLRFSAKTVEGQGRFMGNLVKGEFVWPLTAEAPMSLQFESVDWNYAPVFAAFAGPEGRRDFQGLLSAKVDLKAPRGGFWASTGAATIQKLSLRRGGIELENKRELRFEAKNGGISVRDFELEGDGTYIRIADREGSDAPARKVDVQINTKIDMNLLSIFTPFFEELRGLLSMAVSLKVGPEGSDVIGSAYVDRAFIQFPEFPHAFENLQSDIVFNHKKVVINSLKSDFAGGKIQATGGLELQGKQKVPTNVTGTFEKINLNIPDKIQTSGSGSFTFTGSWFPFLLKGSYNIRDGLMSKELSDTGGGTGDGIRRDQFLPRFLVEESFQPVALDLAIDFSKGIQLKNEMIEGSASGQLRVTGNPLKPSIIGQIRTQNETKIKFRENIFEVSSALLSFEDPLDINPRINLNARTRVSEYDVNLLAQGTAKKPEISVSSVPPMPERDILSLLALGTTDQKLSTQTSSQSQGMNAGAQVLSGVANQALKGVTGKLGVDVQLSPGFDDTDEAYQKVVIKKQFNRRLEASGSQSLGKKSETEAKLRYRVTDRVSGVVSWQGVERGETSDSTGQQSANQDKVGLDFEYKFEFK